MKIFKPIATAIAAIAAMQSDTEKPKSEFASRTFGTHPKRCKSCASYVICHNEGKGPLDAACSSYKKRKKK